MFILLFTLKTTSCSNGLHKLSSISRCSRNATSLLFLCVFWTGIAVSVMEMYLSNLRALDFPAQNSMNLIVLSASWIVLSCLKNKAGTYLVDVYIQNKWNEKPKISVSLYELCRSLKYVVNCFILTDKQNYLSEEYFN